MYHEYNRNPRTEKKIIKGTRHCSDENLTLANCGWMRGRGKENEQKGSDKDIKQPYRFKDFNKSRRNYKRNEDEQINLKSLQSGCLKVYNDAIKTFKPMGCDFIKIDEVVVNKINKTNLDSCIAKEITDEISGKIKEYFKKKEKIFAKNDIKGGKGIEYCFVEDKSKKGFAISSRKRKESYLTNIIFEDGTFKENVGLRI